MSNVSRRGFLKAAAGTAAGVVGAGLALPAAARAAGQLSNEEIIRAWKDQDFRNSLTPEQLARLPEHPSGGIEIQAANRDEAAGFFAPGPGTRGRGCTNNRRRC